MKFCKPLACALALLLAFFGCLASAETITVVDMKAREVTIEAPVTRVVALTASDCEILYALGAGDALVGRGEYCDYPAEVLAVTPVQSGYETNIEQIIALDAQLVLMSTMSQPKEHVEQLERAGIQVAVSEAQDIEGVYQSIRLIGALTARDEAAEALISSMRAVFESISGNDDIKGKSVYFEVSPLVYGLWTAGSGTFMHEVAQMLGLVNCFGDVEGWAQISEEQVLARDPDYIVTITPYFGEGMTPAEEITARAGWQLVKAVQNGAILQLQNDELSRPAPRLAQGAQLLFDFVTNYK